MGPEISISIAPWNAVYVEIPKVACSSIKVALARLLDIDLEPFDGNPHIANFPFTKAELTTSGPLFPGTFSFAFVRNPWDRLVSCYRDKILLEVEGYTSSTIRPGVADCLARFDEFQPGMSFDDFIQVVAGIPDEAADEHFRSQHTFVTNLSGNIAVDFIGRFESLGEDLANVASQTAIPDLVLPRLQAALHSVRYREYFNEQTRSTVKRRFSTDIELFGYSF